MKKLIVLFAFALGCHAQGTLVSILSNLIKTACNSTAPQFLMWNGTILQCVALPSNTTLVNGVLTINPTTAQLPVWQSETLPLTNIAAGSTSVSYTTLKTPVSGVIVWWYNTQSLVSGPSSGAARWSGNPINFPLPTGWAPTDSITIVYQSQ